MDVFPVDTHIYRICRRMELLEPDVPVGRASNVLTPRIRPEDRYALHVLLISHGRQICKARKPRCKQCVLLDLCPEGQRRPAGDAQSSSTP
ncbi:MAG: endonuclease III domain-containing protein [Phycisphaerae bacterium]